MFKAFVSHSAEDKEIIKIFCEKANKKIPFVKFKYVMYSDRPGQDFMTKIIVPMINESDFFVVFYTENGRASPWVNQELGYASCLQKYIIPIVDEDFLTVSIGLLHSNISKFKFVGSKVKVEKENRFVWQYENTGIDVLMERIIKWFNDIFNEKIRKFLEKAESFKEEEENWEVAINYERAAKMFREKNDYKLALRYMKEAANFFKEDGENWETAEAYSKIAEIYGTIGDHQRDHVDYLREAGMWYVKDEEPWEAAETFREAAEITAKYFGKNLEYKELIEKALDYYLENKAPHEAEEMRKELQNL